MRSPAFASSRPAALAVIVVWIALAAAAVALVPKPRAGEADGTQLYLPETYESQAAQARLRQLFPDQYRPATAVVVFHRAGRPIVTDARCMAEVKALVEWIKNPALPADLPRDKADRLRRYLAEAPVRSAVTDPQLAARLNSADGCSTLVLVGMPDIFTAQKSQDTVEALRHYLAARGLMLRGERPAPSRDAAQPNELYAEITGDAGFYADYSAAAEQSVRRSTVVTLILLVVILLVVYRSPAAIFVPLATIALAVVVAMRLLYLLTGLGLQVNSIIEMFVVVIVFGCGTDYCLFLVSRYKEEAGALAAEGRPDEAAAPLQGLWGQAMSRAWRGTAAAITASALTVMAGLSLMSLAVFRAFQKAGPSVAVALGVGLLAALTLAPAICLLMGRAVFWPAHLGRSPRATEDAGGRRSRLAALARRLWPQHFWERVADFVTRRPGLVTAAVVLVLAVPSVYSFYTRPTHNIFDELSADWSCVRGYEILRQSYTPGTMGPATLLVEADPGYARAKPGSAEAQPGGPGLDDERGWRVLADLAGKLGAHPLVDEVLYPGRPLGRAGPSFKSPDDIADDETLERIERYYFSRDRRAARMEILLREGPYTDASVAAAREIQQLARQATPRQSPAPAPTGGATDRPAADLVKLTMLAGPSSTIADIKDVAGRDFNVVALAVLAAIYLILVAVLRRPVLGVLLVFGTLLSFTAALGVADLVFVKWLGQPGLDWKVKFFLLVLLVAVGVDYNIFVCTRIEEERRRRPLVAAVRTALARTGGIVSACGVIVAGTFASMMAGTLSLTVQLGFALAFGILVDTFLIRPLVVPAVALMLARVSERRKAAAARPPNLPLR